MSRFAGRYVFVAGLHRSGTSLVADILGTHPDVSCIKGAPIPEQEGSYLQGAIPHTARHGVPGEFAFDPAQHMIEGHPLDTLHTRERMEADWEPWFTPGGAWRVEKSPVNLLRMRLYQQLFPLAHFIVVVRHPLAVARSTGKWSTRSTDELLSHWDYAHRMMMADLDYLHHVCVVRYEDLCQDPREVVEKIFSFLMLERRLTTELPTIQNRNPQNLDGAALGETAFRLGYGVADCDAKVTCLRIVKHSLRDIRARVRSTESISCSGISNVNLG